ncbi:MAG: hypothetical protein PHN88_04195 [Ignavibacteria bacterium]|nr:hypothetical protein [Ignavibacteria bacterium]
MLEEIKKEFKDVDDKSDKTLIYSLSAANLRLLERAKRRLRSLDLSGYKELNGFVTCYVYTRTIL